MKRAARLCRPLLLVVVVLLIAGCGRPKPPPPALTTQWLTMGTVALLSLPAAEENKLEAAQQIVAAVFDDVETRMSNFRPESEIGRLNSAAGGEAISISAATATVLEYAVAIGRESGGAFDPTVGPLMKLWGFRGGAPLESLPEQAALSTALSEIGYTNIWLSPDPKVIGGREAKLIHAAARLDLGGIAKGFAVDKAFQKLRAAGYENFLVNLAGNMRGWGAANPERHEWRVGVRNPFAKEGYIGVIKLRAGEAVATSGSYERFVMIKGKRYSHIIDPRTGEPVHGLVSVSVVAPDAMQSDALSTTLFVLGVAEGSRLLANHLGCYAIFITDQEPPQVFITPGAEANFQLEAEWQTLLSPI